MPAMGETGRGPMRVVVTGASGSLGEAVLDRLVADDAIGDLVAVDVAPPRRYAHHPKVRHVRADVRDASLPDALRGTDAVLHLAFVVERTGGRAPEEVESINVEGSRHVFRSAKDAGVRHVVYASSIAAYGIRPEHAGRVLTEETPCLGSDDFYYARHKGMVERWLDEFEAAEPEMAVARLRPSIFLSERSTARRVRALLRAPVHAKLSGRSLLAQVTHEDDVADAFVLALKKRAKGAFNVSAEGTVDLNDLGPVVGRPSLPLPEVALGLLKLASRRGAMAVHESWFDQARLGTTPVVSAKKIRSVLRWTPRYETSGDVLRAIAGRPNARASHALRWFWGPMVLATKTVGGIPMTRDTAAQARGFEGEINLVFTGDEPGAYRIRIGKSSFGLLEGTSATARATVTMKTTVFHDIVSGKTTADTVTLSGRVRIRGEGEMLIVAMGAIGALSMAKRLPGAPGFFARRYARFLLE
jgi:UDP-glucose 4-epimerase